MLLANSGLSLHTLAKLAAGRLTLQVEPQLLKHHNGDAKAWMRKNIPPGTQVATIGDQELYYLMQFQIIPVEETPSLEIHLDKLAETSAQNPKADNQVGRSLQALRDVNAKYIYLDQAGYMPHAGESIPKLISKISAADTLSSLHKFNSSAVIDLKQ